MKKSTFTLALLAILFCLSSTTNAQPVLHIDTSSVSPHTVHVHLSWHSVPAGFDSVQIHLEGFDSTGTGGALATQKVPHVSTPADTANTSTYGDFLNLIEGHHYSGTFSLWVFTAGIPLVYTSGNSISFITDCIAPPITITNSSSIICGNSSHLTVSGPTGTTYSWLPTAGLSAANSATPTATPTATTIYTVTATNDQCSARDSTQVTVNSPPTVSAGPDQSSCGGTITLTATGTSGATFHWNTGATTATITVTPTASTMYYCWTTLSGGCQSRNDSVQVVVSATATAVITAGGPLAFCAGGSVVLTANTGTAYQWYNGSGAITGETNQSYTATTSGTYHVVVTTACGTATSPSQTVTVGGSASIVISTSTGATSTCAPGTLTLNSTVSGIFYQDSVAMFPALNYTSRTISQSGTYWVQQTTTGCTAISNVVTITINTPPAQPVVSFISSTGTLSNCAPNFVTLYVIPDPSLHYHWSNGDSTSAIIAGATAVYNVQVTDIFTGCSSPVSINSTVNIHSQPTAGINSAGNPTTVCSGQTVWLYGTGGSTYQWYVGGISVSSIFTLGLSVSSVAQLVAINPYGCKDTAYQTVTVNPNPTPNVSVISATFCNGDSTQVTVFPNSSAYSYLWNTGATTSSLYAYSPGTYSVTVTEIATGCHGTGASVPIHVNPNPHVNLYPQGPAALLAVGAGGTLPYTYLWNYGGGTYLGQTATFTQTTPYTITVTDANGCSGSVNSTLVLGINEMQNDEDLKLYPNPASDVFTLEFKGINEITVSVYNMLGDLLLSEKVERNFIFGDNFSKGMYLMKVKTDKGEFQKRIIKN